MKKSYLIGAVVILLAASGAALWFSGSDDTTQNDTGTSQQTSGQRQFSPSPTDNASFEATMTGVIAGDKSMDGTLLSDGKGNTKFSGMADGKSFSIYSFGTEYITCTDSTCISISGSPSVSPSLYSYSETDNSALQANANYKGKQDCPAGTCDTWEVQRDGQTMQMFVSSDNKINKLSGTAADGKTFAIVYDYKPVTIDRPTNVQTLTLPN